MAVRKYKPTSNGRRNMSVLTFDEITTDTPEKSLLAPKNKKGGRNNSGKITVRHQGGGNKQKYRIIDFKRNKDGIPATVKTIEYDPNRSANIALLYYADGEKRYILAPKGLKVGDVLVSGEKADIKPGNALVINQIPVGSLIHNIELHPGKGGQLARSAGVSAQILGRVDKYVLVRLGSGEVRKILATCKATIGEVGDVLVSGEKADIKPGNALVINQIPVGSLIHNIELHPGKGGQLARSAGVSAQILGRVDKYVLVRLGSGEVRKILATCKATIGEVGNESHELVRIGKAGKARHMGLRPEVRGSVMNPNDHPHGGGEGKCPIGRPSPVTPWGKPALGLKTRNKKKASTKLIVRRRNDK